MYSNNLSTSAKKRRGLTTSALPSLLKYKGGSPSLFRYFKHPQHVQAKQTLDLTPLSEIPRVESETLTETSTFRKTYFPPKSWLPAPRETLDLRPLYEIPRVESQIIVPVAIPLKTPLIPPTLLPETSDSITAKSTRPPTPYHRLPPIIRNVKVESPRYIKSDPLPSIKTDRVATNRPNTPYYPPAPISRPRFA